MHVLLRREGWAVNTKRIYRLCKGLGLQLRAKAPRRRVKARLREDRQVATRPNDTWAMDFVHDQLATGRKIRVLTVVDTFSRFSPVVGPRFSDRAEDVVAMLDATCPVVGYPQAIRVDQGSEFVSRDLDLWAYANNVTLDVSRPGKPTDNAFIEAFNGRFWAECLNAHWFILPTRGERWRLGADTTTRRARMGRLAIRRRSRCKPAVAQPARQRDNRPEALPTSDPKTGCTANTHRPLVATR